MATIDSREIIDKLIANNGRYSTDPPVYRIVEYTTPEGATTWGIEYKQDLGKYYESEWVRNPREIWRRDGSKR